MIIMFMIIIFMIIIFVIIIFMAKNLLKSVDIINYARKNAFNQA